METIRTEIGTYLNACRFQKNLNEKTVKAYRIDLRQFFDFLQESGVPHPNWPLSNMLRS